MTGEKDADGNFKLPGKQTIEFDLLDEQARQEVIKCIETKGRIRVVIKDIGELDLGTTAGFRQLID